MDMKKTTRRLDDVFYAVLLVAMLVLALGSSLGSAHDEARRMAKAAPAVTTVALAASTSAPAPH